MRCGRWGIDAPRSSPSSRLRSLGDGVAARHRNRGVVLGIGDRAHVGSTGNGAGIVARTRSIRHSQCRTGRSRGNESPSGSDRSGFRRRGRRGIGRGRGRNCVAGGDSSSGRPNRLGERGPSGAYRRRLRARGVSGSARADRVVFAGPADRPCRSQRIRRRCLRTRRRRDEGGVLAATGSGRRAVPEDGEPGALGAGSSLGVGGARRYRRRPGSGGPRLPARWCRCSWATRTPPWLRCCGPSPCTVQRWRYSRVLCCPQSRQNAHEWPFWRGQDWPWRRR